MKSQNQKLIPLLFSLSLAACAGGGTDVGAPEVSPPLSNALPAALRTTAAVKLGSGASSLAMTTSMTCAGTETNIQEAVYKRLFCDGPTKILSLTDSIDSRMAEINTRSLESERTCLTAANTDKSSLFPYPAQLADNAFTQKYKCKDIFSSGEGMMAFGNDDTHWWLLESGSGDATNEGISQAWRVTLGSDGSVATEEAYIALAPKLASGGVSSLAGSTVLIHLLVDSTAGTVEATAAGGNIGFKHLHFRSNSTHVYVSGVREGVGSTEEVCLDANTLATSSGGLSDCSSLSGSNLDLTALGRQAYSAGGLDASGAQNVDVSGLSSFIRSESDLSDITAF